MSTKTFCDGCGEEITTHNVARGSPFNPTWRLGLEHRPRLLQAPLLKLEVLTGKDDDGDWCKYCLIDAINTLDDRPKAEEGHQCGAHIPGHHSGTCRLYKGHSGECYE